MSPDQDYVATSVAQDIVSRMSRTHERRRMSVFSGPPGIGKSTAVRRFCDLHLDCVARVELTRGARDGVRSTAALQAVAEALSELLPCGGYMSRMPTSMGELSSRCFGLICSWAGMDPYKVRRGGARDAPMLSIVIDEAQYLHPEGIDALRSLNDRGRRFSPFPIALNLIGNNRFVLKTEGKSQSVIEDQVRDRLLYTVVLGYTDVSDDDLSMFLQDRGLIDPEVLRLVLKHFASGRIDRSFRRAEDFLLNLEDEAAGAPITIHTLSVVLGLA